MGANSFDVKKSSSTKGFRVVFSFPAAAECEDECSTDHIVCKSACANKKKCKKKCKKDKNKCKNSCESKYPCGDECEDNTIPGFGSWWCELNAPDPSFCRNEAQMNKCKKTCGHCG